MAVGIPNKSSQVEDRIKADVQRQAPDSNPYTTVSWLRSLISGVARRIFDFYLDLSRTETRLMPDTADDETAPRWGNIFIGPKNPATPSSGPVVATGTASSLIPTGTLLITSGNEYEVIAGATISDNTIDISSITRSGGVATVTTVDNHNLSSFVPVTITGANETEYNAVDAEITVTGENTFTFDVTGSPTTPATGTIQASHTSALIQIQSTEPGENLDLSVDAPLLLQSPIAGVDDTLYVTFAEVAGGTNEESTTDYKDRYLEKIRNPVAHFNKSDVIQKAKEISGVTRVFVEESGTVVGSTSVSSLTRNGNIATAVTASPHSLFSGQAVTIEGADQTDYNVTEAIVIVENSTTFHYIVANTPITPATGIVTVSELVALGTARVYFMRDNDDNPIPSGSEVDAVKNAIEEIIPANTSFDDIYVLAPNAVPVDYIFSELTPDTSTMRAAIQENLSQFHEEETQVGVDVDQDAYRAAIKNTVDPNTGDTVTSFDLSSPIGDIAIASGEIATKGTVTFSL